MHFASPEARAFHFARLHALQAMHALEALERKQAAMPWLRKSLRFPHQLVVARLQASSTAQMEIYWAEKLLQCEEDKANFNPAQPRVSAGNSDGGQWVDAGGGSSISNALKDPLARAPRLIDDGIRAVPSDKEIIGAIGALSAIASPQARAAIAALRRLLGSREVDTSWTLGSHKSATRWENQMQKRGWTKTNITEALTKGQKYSAKNIKTGGRATRYEYQGRYVIRDDTSKEILQISEPHFKRPPGY